MKRSVALDRLARGCVEDLGQALLANMRSSRPRTSGAAITPMGPPGSSQ